MDKSDDTLPPVNESVLDLSDDVLLALAPAARLAALGALAGDAAHGLGNSLFGVLGLVELLLADAEPGSPAAERLALVRRSALELKETLRALVSAIRPVPDDAAPAPLTEIAHSTAAFFRGVSASVRVELAERYPKEPLPVAATGTAVRQLALHTLQWAWTVAGTEGSIEIEAGTDGNAALLRVDASGNGGERDPGLGLLAAGALARAAGGSLEAPAPGRLLLRVPLAAAAAEKPRADSAAPTMAPAPDRDDHGGAQR